MKRLLAAAMVAPLAVTTAQGQLKVGDSAPPLPVSEWVKGEPQSLAKGKGTTIFVLEFWATWCFPCLQQIPHLTELQQKYADRNVVVIAVTSPGDRGQRLSEVQEFVRQRDSTIGYTVAWDATDAVQRNYLDAVKAMGIPYTFIVGKDGNIGWHGYASPEVDRLVEEMVSGTFDVAKETARAEADARIQNLLPRYQAVVMRGDWEGALNVLNEIVEVDPTQVNPLREVYLLYTQRLEDLARLRVWIERFIERYAGNAQALGNVANLLLDIPEPTGRMPDLMMRAARAAYEADEGKSVYGLVTYARAAQQVGRLDQAIRLQKLAIERAPTAERAELTRVLEYYQACQELGQSGF